MENTYFFKGKNTPSEHVFKYDSNGDLRVFENTGEPLTIKQWLWLFHPERIPYTEERIQILANDIALKKHFIIEKIPFSVTFEDFWIEYGKIGTKAVAKKKFEKFKAEEVIKAFLGIEKERNKKKLDGTAMPYAETYLNQKRWET